MDCTRYEDEILEQPGRVVPVLGTGAAKESLSALDYFWLALLFATGRKDVHGGYFHGLLTRRTIYGLWLKGLPEYLDDCGFESPDMEQGVAEFTNQLKQKGIRFVWPIR